MAIRSTVSVVSCREYNRQEIGSAVSRAISLAGIDSVFKPGSQVLIKPNLLSTRRPEEAVTTHPMVVEAVAQLALGHGSFPAIGDSPPFAGENLKTWRRLMRVTGMSEIADGLGVDIRRFEDGSRVLASPEGMIYHTFEIAEAVAQADAIVNMPKLKTHGLTVLTGAVKNVFGCIPGLPKGLFHLRSAEDREKFAQMLVDLCRAVRPAANVMDAVIGMEGEGPNNGVPRYIGAILASADPVALDAVACDLVGIDPFSIHTTRLAHEQGVGCGVLSQIEVLGTPIESIRTHGFKLSSGASEWTKIPAPIRRMLRRQLAALPRMVRSKCVGCGDCVTACPVDAITAGRPPTVDYQKCIRCYCCHEVCNVGAIALKPGWLGKLVSRLREKK